MLTGIHPVLDLVQVPERVDLRVLDPTGVPPQPGADLGAEEYEHGPAHQEHGADDDEGAEDLGLV